jgi:hypothetical protein
MGSNGYLPSVNWNIMEKSPFYMDKSTMSMDIFSSYLGRDVFSVGKEQLL